MTDAPDFALATDGAPIAKVGAVLLTLKVVEGPAPAAAFPAASEAVAEASVTPIVPSPVQDESETVRVDVPVPETAREQSAVPVLFKVMSLELVVTEVAPE